MSALAGILIFTGWRLLDIGSIPALVKKSKAEAAIYFVTLSLIVAVDLLTGVVIGFVCSLFLLAKRSKHLVVKTTSENDSMTLSLEAKLHFFKSQNSPC